MKNIIYVDIDSDRKEPGPIIIGKDNIQRPERADMVIVDMACLCEALCTLIHLAEDQGIKPSAASLRDCIKHLQDGFADASYETQDNSLVV